MISLSHVGELLIARMLSESESARRYLFPPSTAENNLVVLPKVRLEQCGELIFDGAHNIDVAVLDGDICHAIEPKLGFTRLGKNAFEQDFLADCGTSHGGTRVSGSMIAILEGKLPQGCHEMPLSITHENRTYKVSEHWILICRKNVFNRWSMNGRPKLSGSCKIVVWEDFAHAYCSENDFNKLVRDMLDANYYDQWVGGCEVTGTTEV